MSYLLVTTKVGNPFVFKAFQLSNYVSIKNYEEDEKNTEEETCSSDNESFYGVVEKNESEDQEWVESFKYAEF